MPKWRVRGLVAGPALPDNGIRFGKSCRIRRIAEQESQEHLYSANQRLMNLDLVTAQFGSPEVFSVEMPLVARLYSKHEMSITVHAPNDPLAFDKVEKEAARYLGGLAIGSQRYRFYPSG
jgi:hypothetical protein